MKDLVRVEKLAMTDVNGIAKSFAESGMFADIKSAAQAVVKILAGQEIGIPPFASMSGIHIIQGKPAIGAGLMAASVKASGKYNYRVKEQNEKICSIDFYEGKEMVGNSTFTAEDARKAGTKNMDKFGRNMLFARAISNGIKWFCPDVFSGPVYTPDELGSETVVEDVQHTVVDPPKPKTSVSDKAFKDLLKKVDATINPDELQAVVNSASEKLSLSNEQAEAFVNACNQHSSTFATETV